MGSGSAEFGNLAAKLDEEQKMLIGYYDGLENIRDGYGNDDWDKSKHNAIFCRRSSC